MPAQICYGDANGLMYLHASNNAACQLYWGALNPNRVKKDKSKRRHDLPSAIKMSSVQVVQLSLLL